MPRRNAQLAKLTRPRLPNAAARERLFSKLGALRPQQPGICVLGPPGAGKTTLVSSWLEAAKIPGIWFQVDAGDSDLPTFFYYLSCAAQPYARAKQSRLPLLTPEYLGDLDGFSRRFFRDLFLRLPKGAVIVLDNYQEVPTESPFHRIVANAFSEVPEGMPIVIITRKELPSCYSRLLANESIAVVEWNEIQLTIDECFAIARKRTDLSRETVESLYRHSNGWAAGFILLMEKLQRGAGLRELTDVEALRGIFDYFAGQFFDRCDTGDQRLLLASSLLPKIPESTALALMGKRGIALLDDLHRRHLFTERRSAREIVYQFHGLFREFLLYRAQDALSQSERTAIIRKAANSLESTGYAEDAWQLFQLAGEHSETERIITREAHRLIEQGRWRVLIKWIEHLPAGRLDQNHWLSYWFGSAKIAVETMEAQKSLEKSYQLATDTGDSLCQVLAASGLIQTYMLQYTHFRPLDRWSGALNIALDAGVAFPNADVELRVQSALLISLAYRQPGHPSLARCVERVYALIESSTDANLRALGAAYIFCYGATTGSTAVSWRALPVLVELLRHPEVTPLNRAWSCFVMAWFHCIVGNFEQSLKATREIDRISSEHGLAHIRKFVIIISTWREMFKADAPAAGQWIEQLKGLEIAGRPYDIATYHVTTAWYLVISGHPDAALRHYGHGLPLFDQVGSVMHQVIYRFYAAFAATQCGQYSAARQFVSEARNIAGEGLTVWQDCALHCAHAYAALMEGDKEGALHALRSRFEIGKNLGEEDGVVHVLSPFMPPLCAAALEHAIEPEYVRDLIKRHGWEAPYPGIDRWPWRVRLTTLGEFSVEVGDKRLDFGRKTPRKPLTLLKMLIAMGGSVPERKLIDRLWSREEGEPRNAYKAAVHRLRALIGEDAIQTEGGVIGLNRKHCWVDVWEMESLISQSKELLAKGNSEGAQNLTRKAGRLYLGSFLASEGDSQWVVPIRERLRTHYIRLVETVGRHLESSYKWEDAVDWYLRGLRADDLSESFYQGLMRCYQHMNRCSEAISVFRRLRQTLSVALGVSPSKSSELLYLGLIRAQERGAEEHEIPVSPDKNPIRN